jgi:oxygen-independent coproporphyrinogen III oxidase
MPGVYISYPFCAQKCSFCNFASGVSPHEGEYPGALIAEIAGHAWEWTPDTVYIGGGTPSRLDGSVLRMILDGVPGYPWAETTIEAAPGRLTADNVRAWKDAGINRVSLGVQSFVKQELVRTGRRHDAEIVSSDCALLRAVGIANINIDLIAGLPFQTAASWHESLDWIERLRPPHVSVYLFEIDEDSRLGFEILNNGQRYGARTVPSDDAAADLYEVAVERLGAIGIERYEISNFAQPGMESPRNGIAAQFEVLAARRVSGFRRRCSLV